MIGHRFCLGRFYPLACERREDIQAIQKPYLLLKLIYRPYLIALIYEAIMLRLLLYT